MTPSTNRRHLLKLASAAATTLWLPRSAWSQARFSSNPFALGVGPDDVVAYALPSLPQTHFVLYGAEATGIACAINPLLEAKHVVEILRAAGAKVLVTLGPGPGGELWDISPSTDAD